MTNKAMGMLLGSALILTSAAGCRLPSQSGMPGAFQPDTRRGTTQVLALEREMGDYELLAQQATASGYAVMAVGQPAPGEGEMAATADGQASAAARVPEDVRLRLAERLAARAARSEARLARLADVRQAIGEKAKNAPWTDNGDATESQTIAFEASANGRAAAQAATMSRTRASEDDIVLSATVTFSKTTPSGMNRTSSRTRTVNPDGSQTITFTSEHLLPNGNTRLASWTKTVGLAGGASGSGSITWKNAEGAVIKQSTMSLSGTEDAPEASVEGETIAVGENETPPNEENGAPEAADKGRDRAAAARAD